MPVDANMRQMRQAPQSLLDKHRECDGQVKKNQGARRRGASKQSEMCKTQNMVDIERCWTSKRKSRDFRAPMKDEEEVTQVVRSWAVQEQPVGDEQNHLNHVIHVYHVNDRDSRVHVIREIHMIQ